MWSNTHNLFLAAPTFTYQLSAVEDIQMFSNRSKSELIVRSYLADTHTFFANSF